MPNDTRTLKARKLDVSVPGRDLVRALDLDLEGGEFVTILGQNGAGKTLTLLSLAGLRAPEGGEVMLDDLPLSAWPRRKLATEIALLPQDTEDIFPRAFSILR